MQQSLPEALSHIAKNHSRTQFTTMDSKAQPTIFTVFVFCFLSFALAAETSNGPTAYVSISDDTQYVTARPCAAGCLWYQGDFACGVNRGYYDLAQELQCGCDAINNCYCGKDNAASASSYISECVSSGCSKFPDEQQSAIALYNSYCATANVAQAASSTTAAAAAASVTEKTTTSTKAASTNVRSVVQTDSTSIRGSNTGNGAAGSARVTTAATMSLKTSSTTPRATSTGEAAADDKGLSKSDLIALGVGLGVGIPSLCVALATFCLMRRKSTKAHGQPEQLLARGPMHRLESY